MPHPVIIQYLVRIADAHGDDRFSSEVWTSLGREKAIELCLEDIREQLTHLERKPDASR